MYDATKNTSCGKTLISGKSVINNIFFNRRFDRGNFAYTLYKARSTFYFIELRDFQLKLRVRGFDAKIYQIVFIASVSFPIIINNFKKFLLLEI